VASYVERSLGAGEAVLHQGRPHWVRYAPVAPCFVAGLLFRPLLIAAVVGGLWIWLSIKGSEFAVTTRKVVVKRGIVVTDASEQRLSRIDSVIVSQDLFGQMLGYGVVAIRGSGESFTPIRDLADPFAFKRAIDEAIELDRRAGAAEVFAAAMATRAAG
jgi:uncharacterized membrane protein YdbT with pleckstrin-like domain